MDSNKNRQEKAPILGLHGILHVTDVARKYIRNELLGPSEMELLDWHYVRS